jgi:hypothetical protein
VQRLDRSDLRVHRHPLRILPLDVVLRVVKDLTTSREEKS